MTYIFGSSGQVDVNVTLWLTVFEIFALKWFFGGPKTTPHLVTLKDIVTKGERLCPDHIDLPSCKLSRRSVAPAPRYLTADLISDKTHTIALRLPDNNNENKERWNGQSCEKFIFNHKNNLTVCIGPYKNLAIANKSRVERVSTFRRSNGRVKNSSCGFCYELSVKNRWHVTDTVCLLVLSSECLSICQTDSFTRSNLLRGEGLLPLASSCS